MVTVDCDSNSGVRYEETREIVAAIQQDEEVARRDPDSASGVANYKQEMEFFPSAADFGGFKNHLKKCEETSRNFLQDSDQLESFSEDWKSWKHLSEVEGKKEELGKESDSVYPSRNSTRSNERLVNFCENGKDSDSVPGDLKILSEHDLEAEEKKDLVENEFKPVYETENLEASEDVGDEFNAIREEKLKSSPDDSVGSMQDPVRVNGRKKESDCDSRHLRRCEERPRNFEKIGEELEPVYENERDWMENLLDPQSFNSGRCDRLVENGKNIEKVLESHLAPEKRQNVIGKRLESRRRKEQHGMFGVIEEKLIFLSEEATRCPGRWLEVAEGQDAMVKEFLHPDFKIQDSNRAGNFSDIGKSVFVSNDGRDLVGYRCEAQGKEDAVACSSTSVETQDSRKPALNHVSFLLINEMQETEVKVIGFCSEAPNVGKKNGSRSIKEMLGRNCMNKERKDVSETKLRPILQVQEVGDSFTQIGRNFVLGDTDFCKRNDSLRCNLNSTEVLSKISGVCGTLGVKVDSISVSHNAVQKNCWQGCRRGPSYGKQIQETNHKARAFYDARQKQSILGIRPELSSKAGSGRRTADKGPNVSGISDRISRYKYKKREMLRSKVEYGGRKPGKNGSGADGKRNNLNFAAPVRPTYVGKGERQKRRYSRSKLLELRCKNIQQQKKLWNEIYQGLSSVVAHEYNQMSACYNQKQCHRNAFGLPLRKKNKKDAGGFPSDAGEAKGTACKLVSSEEWLKTDSPTHLDGMLIRNQYDWMLADGLWRAWNEV